MASISTEYALPASKIDPGRLLVLMIVVARKVADGDGHGTTARASR